MRTICQMSITSIRGARRPSHSATVTVTRRQPGAHVSAAGSWRRPSDAKRSESQVTDRWCQDQQQRTSAERSPAGQLGQPGSEGYRGRGVRHFVGGA
jgi:hypothetical protein